MLFFFILTNEIRSQMKVIQQIDNGASRMIARKICATSTTFYIHCKAKYVALEHFTEKKVFLNQYLLLPSAIDVFKGKTNEQMPKASEKVVHCILRKKGFVQGPGARYTFQNFRFHKKRSAKP